MQVGRTWNESEVYTDSLTGRPVRRLTTCGRINQTPTYHTGSGFSADGRFMVFVSVREDATWVIRAEVGTGELKALWRAPGIGDRSYIHRGMALNVADVDGRGICGNRLCLAPLSGWAVFTCERAILAVHAETCETRILLDDCGEEWIFGAPCVSPDERYAAIALSSAHPERRKGKKPTRDYLDFPNHAMRLIRVPLCGGGQPEILYERTGGAQSAHCAFCPMDNDLLYFDLDLAPGYWCGSDGKTPRIRLLDLTTGKARPLKKNYPGPFQVHQAWLWDGSGLAYHGPLRGGGEYVGIAAADGGTLWERTYPRAGAYGHLTPDAKRPALILDGLSFSDRLSWLYYDEDGPDGGAKLEPICLHATEWGSLPGQYSHPHPLTDASGRWISFTAAGGGRSDVYVVDAN